MADWQTLSSEEVYATPWLRVRRDEVLNHLGKPLTYSVVELQHPSAFIVAVNAAGQVYLQQTYRYTLDQMMWEVPAGYSDGEDLLAAGKRELREEAGLASEDWTELGTLYQANGIGKIPFAAFLARDVRSIEGGRDADEDITNGRFVDFAEVEAMMRRGEFIESAHMAAIYLAKLHGLTKPRA